MMVRLTGRAAQGFGCLLACTTVALASCGSSSSSKASLTTAASGTPTTAGSGASVTPTTIASATPTGGGATTAAKTTTGASGPIGDLCALITAADVQAAFGGNVAPGTKNTSAANGCDFDVTGSAKAGSVTVLTVGVSVVGDFKSYDTEKKVFGDSVQQVTGLGTDAWSALGAIHLKVKGNQDIAVAAIGVGNLDKTVLQANGQSLAKTIVAKVGT